ncbi:MAG: hypothetical protein ABUS54_14085 [Actinomycetota bacterium]
MTVTQFLEAERDGILAEAVVAAAAAPRYGVAELGSRLAALFDELVAAVDARDLTSIVDYARHLARARFSAGYDIAEVQVAINALEQAVWLRIFESAPKSLVGEALRVVSTVLGSAKDALAQEYVVLAKAGPATPDPSVLFTAL